jgi:hypothetical protein
MGKAYGVVIFCEVADEKVAEFKSLIGDIQGATF